MAGNKAGYVRKETAKLVLRSRVVSKANPTPSHASIEADDDDNNTDAPAVKKTRLASTETSADVADPSSRLTINTSTMVGKVTEKSLLREGKTLEPRRRRNETNRLCTGLSRTDNGMKQTSWPDVTPINQKNYYTYVGRRTGVSHADAILTSAST